MHDLLGTGGRIGALLGAAHEARPAQVKMAEAVALAMESKSHLIAEAGTGTGKSFAYLVPAMLRCMAGETVVIATHTISLQEQLIQKDIPLLMKAFGLSMPVWNSDELANGPPDDNISNEDPQNEVTMDEDGYPIEVHSPGELAHEATPTDSYITSPIRPVLVKGRGNYVSLRRLKLASARQERLFADPAARRTLHAIEDWASITDEGTLSSLPQLERPGVWDKAQSDSANCMGRRCPTYKICFYQNARRRMAASNLLVCNHALFFADLALRTQEISILPEYKHVVLDEAHNIEDVASEHFGVTLTERRIAFLLASLYHNKSNRGVLAALELREESNDEINRTIGLVLRAENVVRAFFDSLLTFARDVRTQEAAQRLVGERKAPGNDNVCRVRTAGAVANVLSPVMRELSLRLQSLKALVKNEADQFELNSYALRAEMIAADAEVLISQSLPGYAYWIETSGGESDENRYAQAAQRIELACAPIEVGPILRERLFRQPFSVTLTSATLATRNTRVDESTESAETAFSHFMARTGSDGARAFQAESPFDYASQMSVYALREAQGNSQRTRSPNHALADHILHHIEATQGGAFVLFTSFATLNAVASLIVEPLSMMGYPMLAQGRDGSRTKILEQFRENEHSVLLGAASFWQGVDVRGNTLRNVIITKLPFDPPDRPLTQARLELIEQRGGNPFMEDSLPRAIIKFKQGFGRLIRSGTDTGRVVVLDPRMLTARYGKLFIAALPAGVKVIADEGRT